MSNNNCAGHLTKNKPSPALEKNVSIWDSYPFERLAYSEIDFIIVIRK